MSAPVGKWGYTEHVSNISYFRLEVEYGCSAHVQSRNSQISLTHVALHSFLAIAQLLDICVCR